MLLLDQLVQSIPVILNPFIINGQNTKNQIMYLIAIESLLALLALSCTCVWGPSRESFKGALLLQCRCTCRTSMRYEHAGRALRRHRQLCAESDDSVHQHRVAAGRRHVACDQLAQTSQRRPSRTKTFVCSGLCSEVQLPDNGQAGLESQPSP